MAKSPDAFRTISEVADWLGVQAHVLRFWESKFTQIKPIKRAGGRRYYRPSDMLLLGGIKKLLHDDGLTIKGAQKILREQGVSYVCDFSQPLDDLTMAVLEGAAEPAFAGGDDAPPRAPVEPETESPQDKALDGEVIEQDASGWDASEIADVQQALDEEEAADEELAAEYAAQTKDVDTEPPAKPERDVPPPATDKPEAHQDEFDLEPDATSPSQDANEDLPDFLRKPLTEVKTDMAPELEEEDHTAEAEPAENDLSGEEAMPDEPPLAEAPEEPMVMPAFSARPRTPATPPETTAAPAAPKKPRIIELPPLPEEADMPASPSALSALARVRTLDDGQAKAVRPLLARLIRHRASLSSARKDVRKD